MADDKTKMSSEHTRDEIHAQVIENKTQIGYLISSISDLVTASRDSDSKQDRRFEKLTEALENSRTVDFKFWLALVSVVGAFAVSFLKPIFEDIAVNNNNIKEIHQEQVRLGVRTALLERDDEWLKIWLTRIDRPLSDIWARRDHIAHVEDVIKPMQKDIEQLQKDDKLKQKSLATVTEKSKQNEELSKETREVQKKRTPYIFGNEEDLE